MVSGIIIIIIIIILPSYVQVPRAKNKKFKTNIVVARGPGLRRWSRKIREQDRVEALYRNIIIIIIIIYYYFFKPSVRLIPREFKK